MSGPGSRAQISLWFRRVTLLTLLPLQEEKRSRTAPLLAVAALVEVVEHVEQALRKPPSLGQLSRAAVERKLDHPQKMRRHHGRRAADTEARSLASHRSTMAMASAVRPFAWSRRDVCASPKAIQSPTVSPSGNGAPSIGTRQVSGSRLAQAGRAVAIGGVATQPATSSVSKHRVNRRVGTGAIEYGILILLLNCIGCRLTVCRSCCRVHCITSALESGPHLGIADTSRRRRALARLPPLNRNTAANQGEGNGDDGKPCEHLGEAIADQPGGQCHYEYGHYKTPFTSAMARRPRINSRISAICAPVTGHSGGSGVMSDPSLRLCRHSRRWNALPPSSRGWIAMCQRRNRKPPWTA